MGEDMKVNHNTTINDKADAAYLSGQHHLMLKYSLVKLFSFSSIFFSSTSYSSTEKQLESLFPQRPGCKHAQHGHYK